MFSKLSALAAGLLLSAAALAAPTVEMQTSLGRIVIELNEEKAPKTVQNFLQYAKDGFYNHTIFHRVIPGFMIQGGGYTAKMEEKKTNSQIANESKNGLKNLRGTIAMARRAEPHSATAQFFINHRDNAPLNAADGAGPNSYGYAVFGKVVEGMEVVDKIAQVQTYSPNEFQRDVPREPVVIQSVKVISEK